MSRSYGDGRGRRVSGEVTGHLGRVLIGDDGYFARSHDDAVGSPSAKRTAKLAVTRARRRAGRRLCRQED